jgi:hypothetical protein
LPATGLNILIASLTTASVLFGRWKDNSPPEVKSLKDVESDEFRRYSPSLFETYRISYVVIPNSSSLHPNLADLRNECPVVYENASFCMMQYPQR